MIKATLEANGTEYTSEGGTVFEAISNFPLNFLDLKTKSTVIVKDGNKTGTLHLVLFQGRRLLQNPIRRKGFSYQLEALLK